MTIDDMMSMIPLTGEWVFYKTGLSEPYCFMWSETIGHRKTKITCYGLTPSEALEKFLR